jgi:hypothetical protein
MADGMMFDPGNYIAPDLEPDFQSNFLQGLFPGQENLDYDSLSFKDNQKLGDKYFTLANVFDQSGNQFNTKWETPNSKPVSDLNRFEKLLRTVSLAAPIVMGGNAVLGAMGAGSAGAAGAGGGATSGGAGAVTAADAGVKTLGMIAPGSAPLAPIGATGAGTVGTNYIMGGLGELAAVGGSGLGAVSAVDPVGSYITGTGGAEGSLSNPSFWKTIPGQAAKGALFNGGMTAAGGGDLNDVLQSAVIGGISGGAGGYAGQAYGKVAGGAASAATNAALRGGSLSDVAKSTALGGLSQYTPDVAGYAGITNPLASEAINSAARGGVSAAVGGGNIGKGTLAGGLQGLFSAGLDKAFTPSTNSGGNSVNPFFSNLRSSLGLDNVTGKDVGDFAQGLAGVYTGYQQRRQAKDLMSMVGARRGAYETQLRNNLARKDAASGRRSDYAGRETQLQAALAELDSRNAPGMQQLMNAKLGGQTSILQSLLRLGGKQNWFGDQVPKQNYALPTNVSFSMPPAPSTDPYDMASLFRQQKGRLGGGV